MIITYVMSLRPSVRNNFLGLIGRIFVKFCPGNLYYNVYQIQISLKMILKIIEILHENLHIFGNKMPTRCNRGFIADFLLAQHVSGHHYAHHQELKNIIRWLLPVVFRAVVFKLLVWCGAEGYMSGLQDAAASCKPDT